MRKAFTLIELLVVVAIIALLVAILLPSLAAARAQAKSVACLAKLHALGIALQAYTSDYNGELPPYFYDVPLLRYISSASDPHNSDSAPVQAYINYERCPSCPLPFTNPNALTYACNNNAFISNTDPTAPNFRMWSIPRPAQIISFGDGNQNYADGGTWKFFNWETFNKAPPSSGDFPISVGLPGGLTNYDYPIGAGLTGLRYRHGVDPTAKHGWANVIFFDSHAEPIKTGQLKYRNVATSY